MIDTESVDDTSSTSKECGFWFFSEEMNHGIVNSLQDMSYLRCDSCRRLLEYQTQFSDTMSCKAIAIHRRVFAALLYGIYTWLPLNTTSRIVGQFARVRLPRWLRGPMCRAYAWLFSASIEEAEFHNDLANYISMAHFFRRRLLPTARRVHPTACLTSPADGRVISCGLVEAGHLEQVKGLMYTLQALLGPWPGLNKRPAGRRNGKFAPTSTCSTEGASVYEEDLLHYPSRWANGCLTALYHCTIYLGPGDYHGFHSPTDWDILLRRHFPGRLFSVSSLVTSWFSGVFCANERGVYIGTWKYGFFAFVAVGATNVGSIRVFSDPTLVTNRASYLGSYFSRSRGVLNSSNQGGISLADSVDRPVVIQMEGFEELHFPELIHCTKGDQFGEFNFGSTILLIFEAPIHDFLFYVNHGDRVQVGQPLGHLLSRV